MNGKDRIEEMRQVNALRLRDEAEQGTVTIEAPGTPFFDDLEVRLSVTVKQFVADPAGRVLIREFDGT
jgi:hypothetical protein